MNVDLDEPRNNNTEMLECSTLKREQGVTTVLVIIKKII